MNVDLQSILFTAFSGILCLVLVEFCWYLYRQLVSDESFQFGLTRPLLDQANPQKTKGDFAGTLLILTALVFAFGLLAESASDALTKFKDEELRANAFCRVYEPRVFLAVPLTLQSAEKWNIAAMYRWADSRKNESEFIRRTAELLKVDLRHRISQYYYSAKNRVFLNQQFFSELVEHQKRINFIRTLLLILPFAALLSLMRLGIKAYNSRRYQLCDQFRAHNVFALVVCCGLTWAILVLWTDAETDFNLRVFGYGMLLSES